MLKRMLLLLGLGFSLQAQVPAPAPGTPAPALTVETYCKLTLERLKLARSSWQFLKRGPATEELRPMWDKYRTTEHAYLVFGSRHRKEIEDFLGTKGRRTKLQIEAMSADIRRYIGKLGDSNEEEQGK